MSFDRRFEALVGATCLVAMMFVAGALIEMWFVMVPLCPHQAVAKLVLALLGALNVAGFGAALSWFR